MPLLLTILSVLAVWTLLAVLVVGLLLILKTLVGVRGYLERIATGVRAIERELDPLEERAGTLAASLREAGAETGRAARRLSDVDEHLAAAEPAFQFPFS